MMTTGLWIALVVVIVFFISLGFTKAFLKICAPNEMLVFSGRTRRLSDGSTIGYRIIKGGRSFQLPIIETVKSMSLETMPIEIELNGALAKGIIPLNVAGMANIKIAGTQEQGSSNAIERFLGKKGEEIARIAKETLEGSLRGVLATLTPEEANTDRLKFAQEVMSQASEDFRTLGLVLDTFKIQSVSDSQRYLEAIGRKKNAEVQRDARIAEAESEAEARKVTAVARNEASVAEAEAEMITVEAQNRLRVTNAELEVTSNQAEAAAKVAGDIAKAEHENTLEEVRIGLNKKKYQADVVVPAAAAKEASDLSAQGEAAKILEDGKATADAVKLMREQWDQGNTKELFLIQLFPEIVDKVSRVVAENLHIEKLTVVDSGNGNGVPQLVKGLTGSVISIIEEIKTATGLDIPDLLSRKDEETSQIRNELSK
ncbi:MAG: SPFH domain-containing protein [Desulfobacteria bacterium]